MDSMNDQLRRAMADAGDLMEEVASRGRSHKSSGRKALLPYGLGGEVERRVVVAIGLMDKAMTTTPVIAAALAAQSIPYRPGTSWSPRAISEILDRVRNDVRFQGIREEIERMAK